MTVPLYVFEERYKALVKYCLEVEVPKFIITLAKPADSFIHILQVSENPDGTYNLLGHGQERCKIDVLDEQQIAELDGTTRSLFLSKDRPLPLERGDPNLEKVAAWDALDTFRDYAKVFFAFDALKQIDQVLPEANPDRCCLNHPA
jgi:hypothetical protein